MQPFLKVVLLTATGNEVTAKSPNVPTSSPLSAQVPMASQMSWQQHAFNCFKAWFPGIRVFWGGGLYWDARFLVTVVCVYGDG